MAIIEQLLARVAPDGGGSLHMSVKRSMSLRRRLVYWVRFSVPAVALRSRPSPVAPARR